MPLHRPIQAHQPSPLTSPGERRPFHIPIGPPGRPSTVLCPGTSPPPPLFLPDPPGAPLARLDKAIPSAAALIQARQSPPSLPLCHRCVIWVDQPSSASSSHIQARQSTPRPCGQRGAGARGGRYYIGPIVSPIQATLTPLAPPYTALTPLAPPYTELTPLAPPIGSPTHCTHHIHSWRPHTLHSPHWLPHTLNSPHWLAHTGAGSAARVLPAPPHIHRGPQVSPILPYISPYIRLYKALLHLLRGPQVSPIRAFTPAPLPPPLPLPFPFPFTPHSDSLAPPFLPPRLPPPLSLLPSPSRPLLLPLPPLPTTHTTQPNDGHGRRGDVERGACRRWPFISPYRPLYTPI